MGSVLCRFIVGPTGHHSSMSLCRRAISFHPDFSVIFFISKRMCHKHYFALFVCLFFIVFSLSSWTSLVFPKQRANRSVRQPSYRWPRGTSAPAEAGPPGRGAQEAGHLPLAASCRGRSWLACAPPTTENTAGPPAHTVREARAARLPPQSISLKYAAPRIAS